jgi:hypothetical protein
MVLRKTPRYDASTESLRTDLEYKAGIWESLPFQLSNSRWLTVTFTATAAAVAPAVQARVAPVEHGHSRCWITWVVCCHKTDQLPEGSLPLTIQGAVIVLPKLPVPDLSTCIV